MNWKQALTIALLITGLFCLFVAIWIPSSWPQLVASAVLLLLISAALHGDTAKKEKR